ncbi:MAG TPA: hypothetical protein VLF40_01560 [Candidatus Saccharimonadales bacterium]|nr:hypothetical protein [Candidatus Saccharimonadales bacterium]
MTRPERIKPQTAEDLLSSPDYGNLSVTRGWDFLRVRRLSAPALWVTIAYPNWSDVPQLAGIFDKQLRIDAGMGVTAPVSTSLTLPVVPGGAEHAEVIRQGEVDPEMAIHLAELATRLTTDFWSLPLTERPRFGLLYGAPRLLDDRTYNVPDPASDRAEQQTLDVLEGKMPFFDAFTAAHHIFEQT